MIYIVCLLVLAVYQCVNGQGPCVPEPVEDLNIALNSTIYWNASTNCGPTSYLVSVIFVDIIEVEYIYRINDTWLDVSFLPACEMIQFVVVPIAGAVSGPRRVMNTETPAVPGANLTVTRLVAIQQGEDSVYLEWNLNPQFSHCVQYYRIGIWDGDSLPLSTSTNYDNILLSDLPPCTRYQFTVTPIYNIVQQGGIAMVEHDTHPHSLHSPTLDRIIPGPTFADMNWVLPPYTVNRCVITSLILDASPYANITISIIDDPSRPAIPVHVSPLLPDRMYFFRVTTVNSAGPSTPVQIGIQTLPELE